MRSFMLVTTLMKVERAVGMSRTEQVLVLGCQFWQV